MEATMKKVLRIAAFLLMLCIAAVSAVACVEVSDVQGVVSNGTDNENSESANNSEVSDERVLFENLPEKDYGGKTVTFLVPGDSFSTYKSCEIMDQESSPELLNEEVKKRNEMVEKKFNVVIEEIRTDSTQTMTQMITNAVTSNLTDYDVVMPYIPDAASLALNNSFYLMNDFEYLDLTNPCWDQNAVKSLSINNKNYFATGDISLLALACTHAVVFNKDMISEYSLEDPYTLVNDGKWTIDKLKEMAKKVTADVDGNTGMSCKDKYGFLINNNFVTSMYVGSGHSLTGKDAEDIPYIQIIEEQQTAFPIFEKIFELVNDAQATGKIDDTAGSYYTSAVSGGGSCWTAATESVANKLALFRAMAIIDIVDLGNYDCNFGILPVPKYDEAQDDYHSFVSTLYATCVAIPVSAEDPEMSSIIVQAMCDASTDTTKNAYFEVILKLRKIQDNESEEMLDKIFDGRVYDLGVIYAWGGTGSSIGTFMNSVAFSGNQTFTSSLESITPTVEADLLKTLNAFGK